MAPPKKPPTLPPKPSKPVPSPKKHLSKPKTLPPKPPAKSLSRPKSTPKKVLSKPKAQKAEEFEKPPPKRKAAIEAEGKNKRVAVETSKAVEIRDQEAREDGEEEGRRMVVRIPVKLGSVDREEGEFAVQAPRGGFREQVVQGGEGYGFRRGEMQGKGASSSTFGPPRQQTRQTPGGSLQFAPPAAGSFPGHALFKEARPRKNGSEQAGSAGSGNTSATGSEPQKLISDSKQIRNKISKQIGQAGSGYGSSMADGRPASKVAPTEPQAAVAEGQHTHSQHTHPRVASLVQTRAVLPRRNSFSTDHPAGIPGASPDRPQGLVKPVGGLMLPPQRPKAQSQAQNTLDEEPTLPPHRTSVPSRKVVANSDSLVQKGAAGNQEQAARPFVKLNTSRKTLPNLTPPRTAIPGSDDTVSPSPLRPSPLPPATKNAAAKAPKASKFEGLRQNAPSAAESKRLQQRGIPIADPGRPNVRIEALRQDSDEPGLPSLPRGGPLSHRSNLLPPHAPLQTSRANKSQQPQPPPPVEHECYNVPYTHPSHYVFDPNAEIKREYTVLLQQGVHTEEQLEMLRLSKAAQDLIISARHSCKSQKETPVQALICRPRRPAEIQTPVLSVLQLATNSAGIQSGLAMFSDYMSQEGVDWSDEDRGCTFCLYSCSVGISNSRVWLPEEAASGFCQPCHDQTGSAMDLLLYLARIEPAKDDAAIARIRGYMSKSATPPLKQLGNEQGYHQQAHVVYRTPERRKALSRYSSLPTVGGRQGTFSGEEATPGVMGQRSPIRRVSSAGLDSQFAMSMGSGNGRDMSHNASGGARAVGSPQALNVTQATSPPPRLVPASRGAVGFGNPVQYQSNQTVWTAGNPGLPSMNFGGNHTPQGSGAMVPNGARPSLSLTIPSTGHGLETVSPDADVEMFGSSFSASAASTSGSATPMTTPTLSNGSDHSSFGHPAVLPSTPARPLPASLPSTPKLRPPVQRSPSAPIISMGPPPPPSRQNSNSQQSATTRIVGPVFCRGCPWRQIDFTKVKICWACKDVKTKIARHDRHRRFRLLTKDVVEGSDGTGHGHDESVGKRKGMNCMVCTGLATHGCVECPLRICGDCEVLMRNMCKSNLSLLVVLYGHSRTHIRNDAFLLRSDGEGF